MHGVAWFASGGEFLSIETNEVVHFDIHGHVINQYPFERLRLHDIAITKDGERFLAVATLEHSRDGYKPVKARSEKRIVVYNAAEGHTFCTGSYDGIVRLWQMTPKCKFEGHDGVRHVGATRVWG